MNSNSFRVKIFLYYIVVFFLFTAAVLAFQYEREKNFRIRQLENTLDNITEITALFIEKNNLVGLNDMARISELKEIIPQAHIRITVISHTGGVIFDSSVSDYQNMENHLHRPEIEKALRSISGANIRHSETTKEDYYYYAKKYKHYFVRTAVVYDVQVKSFLKAERYYIFFIVAAFTIIGIVLFFITSRMADAITKLRDFAVKAGKKEPIDPVTTFPESELGTIGSQIIAIYSDLKKTKDELATEREKLLSHLNALNEGIAFFSATKEKTLSNRYFIQYLNSISDRKVTAPEQIFEMDEFAELSRFLENQATTNLSADNLQQIEFTISKGEKYLKVLSIIFPDNSFDSGQVRA